MEKVKNANSTLIFLIIFFLISWSHCSSFLKLSLRTLFSFSGLFSSITANCRFEHFFANCCAEYHFEIFKLLLQTIHLQIAVMDHFFVHFHAGGHLFKRKFLFVICPSKQFVLFAIGSCDIIICTLCIVVWLIIFVICLSEKSLS